MFYSDDLYFLGEGKKNNGQVHSILLRCSQWYVFLFSKVDFNDFAPKQVHIYIHTIAKLKLESTLSKMVSWNDFVANVYRTFSLW